MKKIICSLLFIIMLINTCLGARLNLDNNNEFFKNQPCYGLDNRNPSGEGYIIKNSTLTNQLTPIGYIDNHKENTNSVVNDFNDNKKFSKRIKCKIHSVEFVTTLYAENYIQYAPGIIEIKFKHTDGNHYMLWYDEANELYRAYTPEQWEQRYAYIQTIINMSKQ